MMKVGFVTVIREPWGGSEELWAAAANLLLQNKHSVIISAFNTEKVDPKMKQLIDRGAKLLYRRGYVKPGIPVKQRIRKKAGILLLNKLSNPYKKFFQQKPDVIIYNGVCDSMKDDPHFMVMVEKFRVPFILILHAYTEYIRTFDYHEANILLKAFRMSKQNLFVSERNRLVMERFLAEPIPNARIIRNPVNLTSIELLPYPKEQVKNFAMVGNLLINHKGQDLALEVLSQPKWASRNWHLNIYGSGVDSNYLNKLCGYYNLQQRITFHGKVHDIKGVWKQNHILLMPSRLEGIPLAVVEAMLCGRPVIATDVAGHMEWIRNGIDGFIAQAANTHSIDETLEAAWQKRHDWEEMGRNAYERACMLYDPNPAQSLEEIIAAVGAT